MSASSFSQIISECIEMLEHNSDGDSRPMSLSRDTLPSLLEQCEILAAREDASDEPIRVMHHFACTGGTLFSKCIAAMPNVQLLSEVAPYSQMVKSGSGLFCPTDLIRLLRSSSDGFEKELESKLFVNGIGVIKTNCLKNGFRLVLREHSHSKYCWGDHVLQEPDISKSLGAAYSIRSIVTIRHPLDSYLSLLNNGWVSFDPATLEEYANRYFAFLSDHQDRAIFRYEDLVADPKATLQEICCKLDLPFTDDFTDLFSALNLSGDSGRRTAVISRRQRREIPAKVASQMSSDSYRKLCAELGYEADA